MTLKELRDDLSRKIAADKSLAEVELNHVTIEDTQGRFIVDYLKNSRPDSDVVEDDDDDSELEDDYWEEDSELDDDDDDEEDDWSLDDESDGSDLEASY